MDSVLEKRIKRVKIGSTLVAIYSFAVFVFFLLNALGVIDVFGIAEYEKNVAVKLSSMGICIFAIIVGIVTHRQITNPEKYRFLFYLTAALSTSTGIVSFSRMTTAENFAGELILLGIVVFLCIQYSPIYNLAHGK